MRVDMLVMTAKRFASLLRQARLADEAWPELRHVDWYLECAIIDEHEVKLDLARLYFRENRRWMIGP